MRVIVPTRAQMRKVRKEVNLDNIDLYKGLRYNTRTRQEHPYYVLEIDPNDTAFSYFLKNGYIK